MSSSINMNSLNDIEPPPLYIVLHWLYLTARSFQCSTTRYFVGCSAWRYGSWVSGFYPVALGPREYLAYYSRIFNLASVSVQVAQPQVLKRWAEETPENFRFIVRLPTQPTDCGLFRELLEGLASIKEKILAVVVRVPASNLQKDRVWLDGFLAACADRSYSAAVELDPASCFQDITYNILRRRGAAAVWSDRHLNPVVTSDFACLDLTGSKDDRLWIKKMKEQAEHERLEFVAITVDSPDRAIRTLKLLGMPERKYSSHLAVPSIPQKKTWTGRVVMCVDLNAFYPSCEELREPKLSGKPNAVIMTDQKDRITKGVVSSCSYEARKFGVKSAMPLARALALCPVLALRPVDFQYYQQVSEKVMDVLGQFADVLEQASIDEAFLDCSKSAATDPYSHAARIKAAIRERCGLRVSLASRHQSQSRR